jgi:serine protease SohB
MLDPFLPEKPEDVARLKELLGGLHESFVSYVRWRRGAKLADDPDLFTGRFWLGTQAHQLGLIDGIGHLEPKLKELYGEKVRFARYGRRRSLFQRFGATLAQDALAGIEERAAFARFGL